MIETKSETETVCELPEILRGLRLVQGTGSPRNDTACINSAALILGGERRRSEARSDTGDCISPVIRAFSVRINDASWWDSDDERTAVLLPLAPLLVGTRTTSEADHRRRWIAVDFAVRVALPAALDAAARALAAKFADDSARLISHAVALRALPEVVEERAEQAREACRSARSSCVEARGRAAADAAAAAADAADAAAAYAADAAAAYAADAAAAAYAADAADAALECLKRMCEVR